MRRAVLFTGLTLGTCLTALAYMDGARLAVPGVPHLIGVTLGAVLVWLAMAAMVTWLAELLRRHHRTLAAHAGRQGKRGTLAAGRMAGRGGRSVTSRLTAWAGRRWAARSPVSGGMGWAEPEATAERQAQRDAVPPPGLAPGRTRSWWQLAGGHDVVAEPGLNDAQRERDAKGWENLCATCGRPGDVANPLVIAGDGFRVHTSETTDPASGYYDPASAPAPAVPAQNGETDMTSIPEWPGDRMPRSTPTSTGTVSTAKANAPAAWKALAANTADFEPEDDGELMEWMASEVAGAAQYGEALISVYEACVDSIGLDPVAMSAVHDVADAAAECATAMAYARQKFAAHYSEVREAVSAGLQLPFNGRWITGEGEA